MKSKDNNLEKNISRLVKLAGNSDKPGKRFTDSLIDDALGELAEPGRKREEKDKTMKVRRIFAYAAAIIIVCGVLMALMTPALNRARRYARRVPYRTIGQKALIEEQLRAQKEAERGKVVAAREYKPSERAKITYTEAGKPVTTAKSEPAKPSVMQPVDRIVAMDKKKDSLTLLGVVDAQKALESRGRKLQSKALSYNALRMTGKAGEQVYCLAKEPAPYRYPMAHGGTTPPNAEPFDGEFFKNYGVNPFVDTEDDHLSTFATDVDTGSYTIVRRFLHNGHLPPEKAVRVEEVINYFQYGYAAPQEDDFAVYAEAAPWKFGTGRKNSYLLRLGLKAKQVSEEGRKPAILTFVIDVSGSMGRENRLGLVKKSLRMLVERLRPEDKIGIAVYGSRGRKAMDYKGLDEKAKILGTIESLSASGSTYAEEGIRIGYEMAESAYRKGYINRVILCSDGVANVGQTGADQILEVIKKKTEKGITLSAIGFGVGNYNDVLMERLGDKGNGHYAYIDTIVEAKRIFEDNLTGTLQVVARDVKVQVDFNPEVVRSYRLIGYENRDVPDEKFRDDKYDGGEIGAGHSVTALYELKLWPEKEGTVATTYVRYKDAETYAVTEFKSSIATGDFDPLAEQTTETGFYTVSTVDFKLGMVAAEFAEILRKSYWARGAKLSGTLNRAQVLVQERPGDTDIIELADLISKAKQLMEKADIKPAEAEESEELMYLEQ